MAKPRGGRNCFVPGCSNRVLKRDKNVSFHEVPKDEKLRKEWAIRTRTGKKISKWANICSEHFTSSDFVISKTGRTIKWLKKDAVPTLKLPDRAFEKKKVERMTKRSQMATLPIESSECCMSDNVQEESEQEPPSLLQEFADLISLHCTYLGVDKGVQAGNYNSRQDKSIQVGDNISTDQPKFSFTVLNNDQSTIQLTGLPKKDFFLSLARELQALFDHCNRNTKAATVQDQLLLTCMKLKHNLTFKVLGLLFQISYKTASNYFKECLCALNELLKPAIKWPSKESVLANMPKCFDMYTSTRVVLDCTEIQIVRPSLLSDRILSYSHYKGTHTAKILIGIAPSGLITFVSEPYGGKASDKFITEKSGILDLCIPYEDSIMVDKGFYIDDLCAQRGLNLLRPPFLRKQKQFSKEDALLTKNIASARVHVERAIQRIKLFRILNSKIDEDLLPYLSEIINVCCSFVNLGRPILAEDKHNS